jgi:H+/Cl- antiporter ClcA
MTDLPSRAPLSGQDSRAQAREFLRLIGLGAGIGVPAALLAAVFLAFVHWFEDVLWADLPNALGYDQVPWFMIVGLPVAGGLVVWVARRFLPGDGGHSPIHGLSTAPTPVRYAPGIALAAIGTLAFGAVLGPEAPLIAVGSAVGMAVNAFTHLEERSQGVLATAGSFSAVSALFGGPLVAGLLLLEAGLGAGAALIPSLLPGLVAAAIGYLIFVGLGDWGGLEASELTFPDLPTYDGTSVVDLVLAVLVGVLVALLMDRIHQLGILVDRRVATPGRMLAGLLAGGLVVGLLAWATTFLGADYDETLFSGQAAVPELVAEGVGVALVVLVAKAIGYAVCLGCGFRGGPVFPAIFLGVGIATLAVALLELSPTWAVAVGAAAGMTAGTGLVFSSLLFSALLVGQAGHDALPAAVLATTAAWLTRTALARRPKEDAN